MSPAHVGQGGEAPAQDGGGPAPASVPASHRPLLRTRVQPAGGKDQRLGATSVICEVALGFRKVVASAKKQKHGDTNSYKGQPPVSLKYCCLRS